MAYDKDKGQGKGKYQFQIEKTLEAYFKAKESGKQPVGTSVNPLGAFEIKPITQDFNRPVDFPTQKPDVPFNFDPNHKGEKVAAGEAGLEHQAHCPPDEEYQSPNFPSTDPEKEEYKQQKFSVTEPEQNEYENKNFSTEKIEKEEYENKSFSTIEPEKKEYEPPKFSTEKLEQNEYQSPKYTIQEPEKKEYESPSFSTEKPVSPISQTPEKSTIEPVNPFAPTPEKSTVEPTKPISETPQKSTIEPVKPFAPTPEKSTIDPVKPMNQTPEKSTQEPVNPMGQTPEKSTIDPVSPMAETPEKSTVDPINPMEETPEKSTVDPINPMEETPEKSTVDPVNPMAQTPEKSTAEPVNPMEETPNKEESAAELKFHQDIKTKDKKQREGNPGPDNLFQHLNNNESNLIEISGRPGEPVFFKFNETPPAGGTSYQTLTRFGYNKEFTMKSNDNSNWTIDVRGGETIPDAALSLKKGDLIEDVDFYYSKIGKNDFVSLRDESARNNPRAPLYMRGPLVQRGLQRGKDNPGGILEMINDLTAPVIDAGRVAKYLASPDGILFMAKQQGLQLTNPLAQWQDYGMPLHPQRIFNPLAFALQVPANQLGIHGDRHNLGHANSEDIRYEDWDGGFGPNSFGYIVALCKKHPLSPTKEPLFPEWQGTQGGEEIPQLSGIMGPNSLFGIGNTTHRVAQHPVMQFNKSHELYKEPKHHDKKPYAHKLGQTQGLAYQGKSEPDILEEKGKGRSSWDSYWDGLITNGGEGIPKVEFPEAGGDIDPKGEVIGKYGAGNGNNPFDYEKIKTWRASKATFNDFVNDNQGDYTHNMPSEIKIVDYGVKPGEESDSQDLFNDPDNDKDFVKILIENEKPKIKAHARAYNLEVTDKLDTSYSSYGYSGNPAESHVFDKIGRNWTLKFTLAAFHNKELKENYKRLNYFMQLASPKIVSGYASGHISKITVGDLWKEIPCLVDSFDYTINNDAGWDINIQGDNESGDEPVGYVLPIMLDVNLGGKFLENHDGKIWNAEGYFFNDAIWA